MSSVNTILIIAAEYPVRSVVVLKSSKAEVVRTFDITLKGGQNKVIISKLPSTIDTQSVRISGLNPSAPKNRTYLSDVVCSVSATNDDTLHAAVHALEVKKNTLQHEKKVLDTQADVLVKYANSLTGEHASPDVMNGFLTAFVEHGKSNIRAIAELEAQIEEIDKRIKEERQKASLLKGSSDTELTAVITADNDTRVDLKLTYIVNKTHWSPTYELHAVTGDNGQPSRTVSLHYRACITQSTGEDWSDAALILSTVATDTIIKRIPKLAPIRIRVSYNNSGRGGGFFGNIGQQRPMVQQQGLFGQKPAVNRVSLFGQAQPQHQQPQQQQQQNVSGAFGSNTGGLFGGTAPTDFAAFGSSTGGLMGSTAPPLFNSEPIAAPRLSPPDDGIITLSDEDSDAESGEGDGEGEGPAKLVTQTPMALTYTVRGKSSIPSDGKEHVVTIAVLSFETDIEYVSVPRVDPRVYLQCQVKNNSEYRLLPGPVSIILDDSYVSKTTISDVNRNDFFNFTLGDDPSVLISYSRLSKTVKEGSGAFADVVNITTYTTSITVQNKHAFPIEKLTLRDAVPMSDDERVRVVLRKPKELIEATEGIFVKVKKEKEAKDETTSDADADEGQQEEEDGLRVRWMKEKEGLYEYKWRVDADDKIKLETVFEMKASIDLTCSFAESTYLFGRKG